MAVLEHISPLEYITDRDPIPESVLNVARWYKTETLELTFGEYVGRPNEFVDLHKSDLMYYLGNGWHVSEVLSRGSDGKWTTSASATVKNKGESESSNNAKSESESITSVLPDGKQATGSLIGTVRNTSGSDVNYTRSVGEASSGAESESEAKSRTVTSQSGGPYWAAWSKIRLQRRRMQSEIVLQDMIASFTKAYNEGRQINDERYDEIVRLYAIMLLRTENEIGSWNLRVEDFKPLIDEILNACKDALANFKGKVSAIPEDWMKSRVDEINRKFDKLLEEARSRLITQGMYNGTIWPTTKSGIERDRQIALNDLKDQMVTVKIDAYGKIATLTAEIGGKVIDAATRLCALQTEAFKPTELRNAVFKWMLDFMERRDDDYPGLDQLVSIADKLGYADGGMASPTS